MSASERLKALDDAMAASHKRLGTVGLDRLLNLREALPQIVAVVEAAEAMPAPQEHERHAGVPYLYARRHDCDSLRAALAALDEALS